QVLPPSSVDTTALDTPSRPGSTATAHPLLGSIQEQDSNGLGYSTSTLFQVLPPSAVRHTTFFGKGNVVPTTTPCRSSKNRIEWNLTLGSLRCSRHVIPPSSDP